ncbi:histidine phosphatase family protein [Gordonia hydrophobica]|uniref:histidine phosphatase family protein n=1 Tax=Gordonia hydrophobica TaxID=40516 RepID=UPI001FD3CFBE|nr:histidine phosphatase family protein [Gordonia hydrophobica]MBM7367041.1 putative phosphoglycerate mutase [Gordonia hydrophobica]
MNSSGAGETGTTPNWQGQTAAPTRIVLLRHGQTALSVERRYSGRGNPELTELGQQQAAAAGRRIASGALGTIDAVVSSPLARTMATAHAAADALGLPVQEFDGLIETDFGDWEGLTFREAADRDGELHRNWLSDVDIAPPGGESFAQVAERIAAARADLVADYAGRTVLAVSHVTPIKTLLRDALSVGPELLFRLHLDLASICVVEYFPDGGSVVRLANDTAHLQ